MNIWFVALVLITPLPIYFAISRPTLAQKVFLIFVGTVVAHILLNLSFGTMWAETMLEISKIETPTQAQLDEARLAKIRKTVFMFAAYLPSLALCGVWWMIFRLIRKEQNS